MDKIKYIDNDITKGIVIDWKIIFKELRKIIKEVTKNNENKIYIPDYPINKANWFIDLSERSVGKTTQLLLIGLLLYKHYGIKTEYIRDKYEQIAPKYSKDMWKVIIDYSYVEKIFGCYNEIEYKNRGWYLCKKENGKIILKDENECCHMHCLTESDNAKSSYSSPFGDWIIYDEFIPVNGITTEDKFISLCQLISTISRMRLSTKIVLSANTINKYTQIFKELLIFDAIQSMKKGDEKIITSDLGVNVYVHIINFESNVSEQRKKRNLLYFGFKNPRLESIIGGSEWETYNFPHLQKKEFNEKRETLVRNIFFEYMDKLLQFKIEYSTKIGLYGFVTQYTGNRDYDTMIIYTLEQISDKRCRYGLGSGNKIDKLIEKLLKGKQVFYATNYEGNIMNQYLKEINTRIYK